MLAKGLIGFVLPGGVLFFWIVWRRQWRLIPLLFRFEALLVFALIALPWFILMQIRYPGFFDCFIIYHHFQRFAAAGFNNQEPFWFYVPATLLLMLPWSLWLIRALIDRWRNPATVPPKPRLFESTDSLRSLMLIWLLVILLFFSIPKSKLIGYILPILPPLALFISETVERWLALRPRLAKVGFYGTLLGAVCLCVGIPLGMHYGYKGSSAELAERARVSFHGNGQLVMLKQQKYDLPFYLRAQRPVWVIDNWQDEQISKHDNWRKELHDAAQFEPATARGILMNERQFQAKLCSENSLTFWVWAERSSASSTFFISHFAPYTQDRDSFLWRLTTEDIRRAHVCDGMPKDG